MTMYLANGDSIIVTELKPTDGRKSFYGKAKVSQSKIGVLTLYSYDKAVAVIENGQFRELEGHCNSQTTQRHIKAFKETYGIK